MGINDLTDGLTELLELLGQSSELWGSSRCPPRLSLKRKADSYEKALRMAEKYLSDDADPHAPGVGAALLIIRATLEAEKSR